VALAVVCIFGIALAGRGLLTVRIGNGPWSVDAMAPFILIVAFAFIEVGWLWIQREVDISDGAILVADGSRSFGAGLSCKTGRGRNHHVPHVREREVARHRA